MGTLTTAPVLPSKLNNKLSLSPHRLSLFPHRRRPRKKNQAIVPVCDSFSLFYDQNSWGSQVIYMVFDWLVVFVWWVWLDQVARLFGPAIFESSKLKVLFLGVDDNKHPGNLPRTYTLTHSDITSKLTLAISQTINNSQVLFQWIHSYNFLFLFTCNHVNYNYK